MLDDHRRKAVATIGDFGHRASLPSASLPSHPVTLTKRTGGVRPNAKEDGHISLHSGSLGVWKGAGERPCAVPLWKSRKSPILHTKQGFIWGIPTKETQTWWARSLRRFLTRKSGSEFSTGKWPISKRARAIPSSCCTATRRRPIFGATSFRTLRAWVAASLPT